MNHLTRTLTLLSTLSCWLGSETLVTADQHFLLNASATSNHASQSSPSNVISYIQQKFGASNAASDVKVGVAVIYYPGAAGIPSTLSLLTNDLAIAKRLNVPIFVQVNVENVLPTDLLNWHDPGLRHEQG